MGYHASSLISLLVAKERHNDFVEMMFHHLVTFYLYSFSFLSNLIIGGVIAYLHDITDIFVTCTRIFSETNFKKTTGALLCWTIIVWVYTRLYVFFQCIYIVTWRLQINGVSPYLKPIFSFLLQCLFILHIYWFFLCLKISFSFIKTGKNEDLANKIKSSKKHEDAHTSGKQNQQKNNAKKIE